MGKEVRGRFKREDMCMYACGSVMLMYYRNHHNIVK